MTSKHRIVCIALSAAVAFKLFAGTADAAVLNAGELNTQGRGLVTVLHDASGQLGRGVDIARVDGEIVSAR
jgi:hypothetical protein